ncbi:MAG: Transcriptional regulator, family [Gemmatimonadetes bacterium]|nr:Transcriptional regulator, family [Gemmatimonadota bacterium]
MDEALFNELVASVREAGAIRRNEAVPARVTRFDDVDVKAVRENFHLSQPQFAAMLGISVGTLRGWEQGRRYPEGPARVLLRVAEAHPDAVLSVTRAGVQAAAEPSAEGADAGAPSADLPADSKPEKEVVYPRPKRKRK